MIQFLGIAIPVIGFLWYLKRETFGEPTPKSQLSYLEQNMTYKEPEVYNKGMCTYSKVDWPRPKPVVIDAVEATPEVTVLPVSDSGIEDTKAFDLTAYDALRANRIQESMARMHERIIVEISNEIAQAIYLGMRVEDAHIAIRTACESFSVAINDSVITEIVLEAHKSMEYERYNELRPL
ncbi:hypothetical protein PBI_PEREGRIN_271 [Rhodococcus phage Peregrin]|nr:hypothetical protein PBI_PEREGRIN_271 [Rhodococcus phage Peregrin]